MRHNLDVMSAVGHIPAQRSPFLRAAEVARELGISRNRVYQLMGGGVIPAVKIGRRWWVPVAAWERWVSSQATRAFESCGAEGPSPVGAGDRRAEEGNSGRPATGSAEQRPLDRVEIRRV